MPANWGSLRIGCPSLYSQFAQLGSEIVDSLWPTFEIFPFFGDASQRPGAISTAWCGTQSHSIVSMETKRTSRHQAERKAVLAQAKQKSRERAAMLPNEPSDQATSWWPSKK